jgi:hypothetical protein
VGVDGRVLYGPGSYGGTTAGAALRVGFVPKVNRLRPFLAIGGGIVTSVLNPGFGPVRYTNGALRRVPAPPAMSVFSMPVLCITSGAKLSETS